MYIKNWFSNFDILSEPIEIDGVKFKSVEALYQSFKCLDINEINKIAAANPSYVKKLGKTVQLRPQWEEIKLAVMLKALSLKFSQPVWRTELELAKNEYLVEFNNWGDRFWGVPAEALKTNNKIAKYVGKYGENWLGRLLMFIRDEPQKAYEYAGLTDTLMDTANLLKVQRLIEEAIPKQKSLRNYDGAIVNNSILPSQRLEILIVGDCDNGIYEEVKTRIDKIIELGANIQIFDVKQFNPSMAEDVDFYLKLRGYEKYKDFTDLHVNVEILSEQCDYALAIGGNLLTESIVSKIKQKCRHIK